MDRLESSGRTARRNPAGPASPRTGDLHMDVPLTARHRWTMTPLGRMVVAVGSYDGHPALTGSWFEDQQHFPSAELLGEADEQDPLLGDAVEQLDEWFGGRRRGFDLPLALDTRPQELRPRVWRALLEVGFGRTTTYGQLARELGTPGMSQAVGQAVGRNPWSVIVPCHRVISSTGALTGYAGGIERKKELLRREAQGATG